jgi:hypothetical protein
MSGIFGEASIQRSGKAILLCLAGSFITGLLLSGEAYATENGASVYPLGVDTVLGGMMPPPKETKFFVFESFYSANEKDNSAGQSVVPEFKIRVFASAVRVAHNWGVPVLGGRLESLFAVPVVYEQLHIAPGKYDKTGISNVDLTPFVVGYNKGNWHWFYRCDFRHRPRGSLHVPVEQGPVGGKLQSKLLRELSWRCKLSQRERVHMGIRRHERYLKESVHRR